MRIATIEDQLAEAGRGIDRLGEAVATRSAAAHRDADWGAFAAAVESELRGWDTYLERLQAKVAAAAWEAREQAEAAIAEVRSRRIAVGERLEQTHDDLKQHADELSAHGSGKEQR